MAGWKLPLGDVVVTSGGGDRYDRYMRIEATRDGQPAWELALDATGGNGALVPRMKQPEVVAGHLLVRTDGEHDRGGTSHEFRLHVVDERGRLLWWKPWRLTGPAVEARRGLLVLCVNGENRVPAGAPVAFARLVRWRDGKELRQWSFNLSGSESERMAKAAWPVIYGSLSPSGKRWRATVEVRWSGGSNTLTRDLPG